MFCNDLLVKLLFANEEHYFNEYNQETNGCSGKYFSAEIMKIAKVYSLNYSGKMGLNANTIMSEIFTSRKLKCT